MVPVGSLGYGYGLKKPIHFSTQSEEEYPSSQNDPKTVFTLRLIYSSLLEVLRHELNTHT